jgi:hypothetical protein
MGLLERRAVMRESDNLADFGIRLSLNPSTLPDSPAEKIRTLPGGAT